MGGHALARRRTQRGAAAVEFALLVPLVLALVFWAVSYGYMFSFRQALSQAAAEGARASVGATTGTACATSGPYASTCPAQLAASQAVASSLGTYGMACGASYLTCSISAPSTTGCTTGHSCVTVTVTYPYRDHNLLPTIPGFGFSLPATLSFTSVVVTS